MEKLKAHYEQQLSGLQLVKQQKSELNNNSYGPKYNKPNGMANEMIEKKIKALKDDLIGGERANDVQLREKHIKRKIAAEKRLRLVG